MLEFKTMSDRSDALQLALTKAGGLAGLADPLGISIQAISQWDEVPPLRVIAVEKITGVPRHVLRPDLYPIEPVEGRA